MNLRKGIILLIAILIIAGIALILNNNNKENKEQLKKPKKKVQKEDHLRVQEVQNDTLTVWVTGLARVKASKEVTLSSEVSGKIHLIPGLKEGRKVGAGQYIGGVNDKEVQLSLKARKSGFINMVAGVLPDIRLEFSDRAQMWQDFLSAIDLDKPLPQLPQFSSDKEKIFLASRNILGEYYGIRVNEEQLKKYQIYTPFSGAIKVANVESGASVNPGTPIVTMVNTSDMEITVPIQQEEIGFVKVGANVAISSSDAIRSWKGKVSRVSSVINENTMSFDVFIRVNNTKELYDGMYVNTKIYGGEMYDVVSLPRRAIQSKGNMFVLRNDGKLYEKKVDIKKYNQESVFVRGLKEGDAVVVEPVETITKNKVFTPSVVKENK